VIPRREPDQSFDGHQRDMAAWVGCASVDEMNAMHDPLHHALCGWLGVTSHAMLDAAGLPHDAALAAIEEEAVLHCQRLAMAHGAGVP